jgi:hypothetical protein
MLELFARDAMSMMAAITLALALFTAALGVVSLYVMIRTLFQARRSAGVAEAGALTAAVIGLAQARAQLSVDDVSLCPFSQRHALRIFIRNSGQSAARGVRIRAVLTVRSFETGTLLSSNPACSFPNVAASGDCARELPLPLSPACLRALEHGGGHIIVQGHVIWLDVFGFRLSEPFRYSRDIDPRSCDRFLTMNNDPEIE